MLEEMPASFNRVVVSSVKFRTVKTVSEFVSILSALIVRLWCSSVCGAVEQCVCRSDRGGKSRTVLIGLRSHLKLYDIWKVMNSLLNPM